MESAYKEILRQWESKVGYPQLYENLDKVFPEFSFRRLQKGTSRDHWASRYKMDLTLPKNRNAEKTVVYRSEMKFREQGEWDNPVGVMEMVMRQSDTRNVYKAWEYIDFLLFLGMPKPDSVAVESLARKITARTQLLSFLQSLFVQELWDMSSRKAGETRAYLKSRGFSKDKAAQAGFGHVPEWGSVIKACAVQGFRIDDIDAFCGIRSYDGKTRVGKTYTLSIPYMCAGELKGFIFRRIDGNQSPKYMATKGLDRASVFFNMPAAGCKRIVVVEGEMDALSATAAGFPGVVAIGGSSIAGNRKRMVEDALKRGVEEIVLFPDLDADAAGRPDFQKRHTAIMQSIHTIKDAKIDFEKIFVVQLENVTDPDQCLRERGVVEYQVLLRNAVPYWEYLHFYICRYVDF